MSNLMDAVMYFYLPVTSSKDSGWNPESDKTTGGSLIAIWFTTRPGAAVGEIVAGILRRQEFSIRY